MFSVCLYDPDSEEYLKTFSGIKTQRAAEMIAEACHFEEHFSVKLYDSENQTIKTWGHVV